jgi:hypothetical protein
LDRGQLADPVAIEGSRTTATRIMLGTNLFAQFEPFAAHAVFERRQSGGVGAAHAMLVHSPGRCSNRLVSRVA